MHPDELKAYLYQAIPISQSLSVDVLTADHNSVLLAAPLAPNINHSGTFFGGSASTVCILAAWSLVYTKLVQDAQFAELVIMSNNMHYEKPIHGDVQARAILHAPDDWPAFIKCLMRRHKARIKVDVCLSCAEQQVGLFSGDFVATN
ncbi:MAG: YiiD C-terminal domain-containing protein [Methylophaga sp.]